MDDDVYIKYIGELEKGQKYYKTLVNGCISLEDFFSFMLFCFFVCLNKHYKCGSWQKKSAQLRELGAMGESRLLSVQLT